VVQASRLHSHDLAVLVVQAYCLPVSNVLAGRLHHKDHDAIVVHARNGEMATTTNSCWPH